MHAPAEQDQISPRQLEAFKATIEKGSVTAAADSLNISQPSVSRLLLNLEASIGFDLFKRQKRRLLPTPEAMLFYEEIEKYFRNMRRLAHTAAEIRALMRGQLRLGSFIALAIAVTPEVIRKLNAAHPDMHVSCTTTQSRQIVDLVESRFADLGIVDPIAVTPAVRVERRWQFRCVCALPEGHPLTARETIGARQLQGETVIGLEREFLTRFASGAAVYDILAPDLRLQVHQSIAACALVAEGIGPAIVDPFTARQYAPCGIVIRPLEAEIPFEIAIISSPEAPLSIAAREFLDLFEQSLSQAEEDFAYIRSIGTREI